MFTFIDKHHHFIFTVLPDFLHNKWTLLTINLIFFVLLIKLSNFLIDKFLDKICQYKDDFEFKKQLITLKSITKSIIDTIIVIFAVIYTLNVLGVDIRPILTAAGVLGVAVGFGAKRFFEDIIAGASLLIEGQVRVGDYIDISGHEGIVEKIDIRLICIRDVQGRVHYIRNGMVDTIVNYTREFSYYVFNLGVSYDADINYVTEALKEVDENFRANSILKEYVLAPLEILGVDKFDDSAIIVKARVKTYPIKQWEVGRAYNKAIKEKFDEKGIEIPFPQRTLHIKKEESQ